MSSQNRAHRTDQPTRLIQDICSDTSTQTDDGRKDHTFNNRLIKTCSILLQKLKNQSSAFIVCTVQSCKPLHSCAPSPACCPGERWHIYFHPPLPLLSLIMVFDIISFLLKSTNTPIFLVHTPNQMTVPTTCHKVVHRLSVLLHFWCTQQLLSHLSISVDRSCLHLKFELYRVKRKGKPT